MQRYIDHVADVRVLSKRMCICARRGFWGFWLECAWILSGGCDPAGPQPVQALSQVFAFVLLLIHWLIQCMYSVLCFLASVHHLALSVHAPAILFHLAPNTALLFSSNFASSVQICQTRMVTWGNCCTCQPNQCALPLVFLRSHCLGWRGLGVS